MLEPILKFANKNPQVVIVSLLAVITAGSIAGGFYIQSLRSTVDDRDKVFEARLKLAAEDHDARMDTLRRVTAVYEQQVRILQASSGELSSQLESLAKLSQDLLLEQKLKPGLVRQIESMSANAQRSASEITQALARVHDVEQIMPDKSGSPAFVPFKVALPSWRYLLVLALLSVVFLQAVYIVRLKRRHIGQSV